MGRRPKRVNEHFFDRESKGKYYVVGAFYRKHIEDGEKGIIFKSRHRDLVSIVKSKLKSKHAINSHTTKSSHCIQMRNVPYLRSKLEALGVKGDMEDREFPNFVPEIYLDHYIRGLFDAQARISLINYSENVIATNISLRFNNKFLVSLDEVLKRYANVSRPKPISNYIIYSGADSSRIYNFIYRDIEYIENSWLYLPFKKKSFVRFEDKSGENNHIICLEKIKEAKKLLIKGKKASDVASDLGYAHKESFLRAFKHVTGQTTRSFLRKNT